MRVLYPISARVSDFVNDGAEVSSGLMGLWSVVSVVLLLLVSLTLSSFEGGAADKQHEAFSSNHFNHAGHVTATHTKQVTGGRPAGAANAHLQVFTQDYIDAHRCVQNLACLESVKRHQPGAVTARLKASAGLYL